MQERWGKLSAWYLILCTPYRHHDLRGAVERWMFNIDCGLESSQKAECTGVRDCQQPWKRKAEHLPQNMGRQDVFNSSLCLFSAFSALKIGVGEVYQWKGGEKKNMHREIYFCSWVSLICNDSGLWSWSKFWSQIQPCLEKVTSRW